MNRVSQSRRERRGMILVNVLFVVAIAATVVMLMITSQDVAVDRTVRLRQAAQASAYARAGELSARVALRRDASEGPGTDHAAEAWGAVQDEDVAIAGGRFSLKVTDAQGRFNINNLRTGNLVAISRVSALLAAAGLPPESLAPIVTYVRFAGPISEISDLAVVVPPAQVAALTPYVTALPVETEINVNAADERLLAVLIGSPVSARLLVSTRDQKGFLTPQDLASVSVIQPPGVGFTSNFFVVETDVIIGDTRQRLISSLMRRPAGEVVEVVAYARKRTAAEPVQAPPRR